MTNERPKVTCPNCKTVHDLPEYQNRLEEGKTIAAPNDIYCCDTFWRPWVPLFATSQSGYELRQLNPNEEVRE